MSTLTQLEAPTAARLYPLRAAILCLVGAILSVSVFMVQHADIYLLAVAFLACLIVPIWSDWNRGRLDLFEPIHVIGGISFLYFALGAIWTVQNPSEMAFDRYAVAYVPLALLYCLMGYLALMGGYYGSWRGLRSQAPAYREEIKGALLIVIPGVLGTVGFLAAAMHLRAWRTAGAVSVVMSTLSQMTPLFLFAWCLAWVLFFSGRMNRLQRFVLFGGLVPGALMAMYVSLNTKGLPVLLGGIPMIAWWYAKRRLPWKVMLLALLILIFVIFPFYSTYRIVDVHKSRTERVSTAFHNLGSWGSKGYASRSVNVFKGRLGLINSVAVVVRDVDRWVPYAKGETIFVPFLTYFVPRALWPDKPVLTQGHDFGERFRLLHIADRDTNISATVPGELYWNFDLPGILVGMFLWGMLLRAVYRRYGVAGPTQPTALAVQVVLLIGFVGMSEGHVAGHLASLIRTAFMLEVIRWGGRRYGLLRRIPTGS